jgi:hypothetical protein
MCSQLIVRKALSWGIIGTSAPMLAAITIRKSQQFTLPFPLRTGYGLLRNLSDKALFEFTPSMWP